MGWITLKDGRHVQPKIKEIRLSPKKYGEICHEIETHGNKNQKVDGKINYKEVGKHLYTYTYSKKNGIKFHGKYKLEGNEKKIKRIKARITEVNRNEFF